MAKRRRIPVIMGRVIKGSEAKHYNAKQIMHFAAYANDDFGNVCMGMGDDANEALYDLALVMLGHGEEAYRFKVV